MKTFKIRPSVWRVAQSTPSHINEKIKNNIKGSIREHSAPGAEGKIEERLRALDREWDIERTLQTHAASAALVGLGLSVLVNKKWLAVPTIVAGFLLQHSLHGWCPPLPILRRLGFRTPHEIEEERYALKALRGDFKDNAHEDGSPLSATELYDRVIH